MAWAVKADPEKFSEAIDFFGTRTVLTKAQVLELELDVRGRAFWVGRGLQLTQIQRVFDSIGKAVESGESFNVWRNRVRDTLTDDAHAQLVFRNAVQRSYSAGRWRQLQDPELLKLRPYLMYDVVLDTRTSAICEALGRPKPTILPADDPYVQARVPPLHHGCRTALRSLRKSQAERKGVTTERPDVEADEGFGAPPGPDDPVWKPDPSKHDPALINELNEKKLDDDARAHPEKAARPPRKERVAPAVATPKEHDPAFWEQHYRRRGDKTPGNRGYGDASPALAWGRAMEARAGERTIGEVADQLEKMAVGDSEFALLLREEADGLRLAHPQHMLVRDTVGHDVRARAIIAEHARAVQTSVVDWKFADQQITEDVKGFYEAMLDRSVVRPGDELKLAMWEDWPASEHARYGFSSPRSYFLHDPAIGETRIVMTRGAPGRVAIHELAHALELSDARAGSRSVAFIRARANGKLIALRTESANYEKWEAFWDDQWRSNYVGHSGGRRSLADQNGSEVTSKGYEWFANPNDWGAFLKEDREHFFFTLGQLAGR